MHTQPSDLLLPRVEQLVEEMSSQKRLTIIGGYRAESAIRTTHYSLARHEQCLRREIRRTGCSGSQSYATQQEESHNSAQLSNPMGVAALQVLHVLR